MGVTEQAGLDNPQGKHRAFVHTEKLFGNRPGEKSLPVRFDARTAYQKRFRVMGNGLA